MAAVTVDVGFLSGYLGIPEPTIQETLDAPTTDLVSAVLAAVTAKAREHQELEADKHQVDTELESAVLESETRTKALKEAAEKASKEAEELRNKLAEEEKARSAVESELERAKASTSTSSSESEVLRSRIASLETANRDTLAIVASKSAANDSLAQDLQKQHQKGLELSQQVAALQQSVQDATSALSSAKFREQNIRQELEQAKRNNEWLDNELKTKSAESLKTRKEKGARIAELTRQNEEVTSSLEAIKRTETALRTRLEEVQAKAEDSLSRIQQLQEAAASTEEGFRQELESSRRLAELQKQQADTHRARLKEVEALLEKARDDSAAEAARYQQNAEVETQERNRLENRISELEAEVDRLEAAASATYPASMPGTPRQGMNGSVFATPSKFATPGSMRKSTITATQAIEELYKVKGQLATERRRNERLSSEMEEMMQGLEAKQPEIEEMQNEHERLQQEVVEMSKFVDAAGKERDQAKKDARKAMQEAKNAHAETGILRQQLRDLSAQIKMLLCDLDAHQRGIESLNAQERAQMERLARGEVTEDAFEGLTDTDKFISERLVVFRSVSDLQEKNEELLRITRELGAKMESEEALAEKSQAAEDHAKVEMLERQLEQANDEMKSMVARSDSYIKERDMFRRMLQHRGQIPREGDMESMFGQSINGGGSIFNSIETPNAKDNQNYAQLLRELQGHFDQYREEQTNDRRTLKEQSDKLASDKAALQSEIARINSQLTLAGERYEMLNANYSMLKNENIELQKRSQNLSESAAKQDLRTQQVAEDLIEARGLVESMRNEIANLKAEKNLWTEIQGRLNQDNENLINERSRLNAIISNQQSLQNERELSESEARRRLQTQVETLESELISTKRKLTDEVEDNKKAQLRKEYDAQQSQKRIDELATTLSSIREEMVAAKTERDLLQKRVDELTIELKSAEEKLEVLQKPTEAPETVVNQEQQLQLEVSELKRDLELKKGELEDARAQVEQYKEISQSSEEDLQRFQETHEEYEKEMDKILAEKDEEIKQLQDRVNDLSSELTNTNNELNKVRSEQAEAARRTSEEKAALEAEVTRLKEQDEANATAAQYYQQDLRAQAEIATKAQQDYEQELIKHAEIARALQELRAAHNTLKSSSAELKAEAESAKVALSQSEASWNERRAQFEKELQELRTRKDDIASQNSILLSQLESVNGQVTELKQSRAAALEAGASTDTPETGSASDKSVEGLRELVTYLRRDKEIVDVQYELAIQDGKRLKQQLDYAKSQLDETRLKLDQERRAHADGSHSNVAHKDLMEKLNELNLYRESSITLRNEVRQAQAQLEEKTKKVEELLNTIQPLETKVRELENAKEMQDGEMKLLQEDRDRWQKRNQEILSKYDRIDPAEMEQLKENLASLTAERDELAAAHQPLQEKMSSMEAQWQATRAKIVEQAKERSRLLTKEKNDRIAERDAVIQQKEALEQQLVNLQQTLDNSINENAAVKQTLSNVQAELEAARADAQAAHAIALSAQAAQTQQPNFGESVPMQPVVDTKQLDALNQELQAVRSELQNRVLEKQEVQQQLNTLREELTVARRERDEAASRAVNAETALASRPTESQKSDGADEGEVNESAPPAPAASAASATSEELEQLRERTAAAEKRVQDLESSLDATLKARSDKMKAALNKRLAESRETMTKDLEEQYNLRLEQEKQIWLAENKPAVQAAPAPQPPAEQNPPATPSTPSKQPPTQQPGTPSSLPDLTEDQARNLLGTNLILKNVFVGNMKKKMDEAVKKLREEFDREKEEAAKKSDEAKVQAVNMEGKKSELKLNMANNRERTAQAKLKVVEKFAKDEPQKPVVEVWEIAKVAKPEPVAPAAAAVPKPGLAPSGIPPPTIKSESAPPSGLRPPSVTIPAPAVVVPQAIQQQHQQQQSRPQTPAMQMQQPQINGQQNQQQQQTSNIPAPQIQTSGIPQPGGGRTGLPVPRGGRGGGRGAYQAPRGQSGIARGGRGGRGGMNGGAQAFSPGGQQGQGQKRGFDGDGGGQGKRMRGGGGGGQRFDGT